MTGERYTTEKSTLKEKSEWGSALGARHRQQQQYAHLLHLQHQNLQQTQHSSAAHDLLGGCFDDAVYQPDAGIPCEDNLFESANAIIDVHSAKHACHVNASGPDSSTDNADVDMGTAHVQSTSAPGASTRKRHTDITTGLHQAKSVGDHAGCIGQGGLSMSSPIRITTSRRTKNASMSSLTVRPTGTKDRHSKVRTAKGLRDRRVRLSAPTAIQFFDVQDRLGYDQPSKAVDWLIKKARAAIDELAPVEAVIAGDDTSGVLGREGKVRKDHHHGSVMKIKDEEQNMAMLSGGDVRAESRAKARERARERAKEKAVISSPTSMSGQEVTATLAAPTPPQPFMPSSSSSLHLSLPEFFLLPSQLRQPLDDQQRSTDQPSSMLPQLSSSTLVPHFLPLSSHFFPCPLQSSASAYVHSGVDVPLSFQFSAPPIHTNTQISPRGTLQSIFSNPASFSMQPHMPMAQQGMSTMGTMQQHMYGTAFNSIGEDRHDTNEDLRQRSAELGSPDLHQHARIPMRIHGMEALNSHVEETRITTSSMQADFQ